MAQKAATKTEILKPILPATGFNRKQVASVLDALSAEINKE